MFCQNACKELIDLLLAIALSPNFHCQVSKKFIIGTQQLNLLKEWYIWDT